MKQILLNMGDVLGESNSADRNVVTHFDSDKMERIVNDLAFPRLVGSQGDAKCQTYIEKLFGELGIHVKKESFITSFFWISTVLQIGVLAGIILSISLTYSLFYNHILHISLIVLIILILAALFPKISGSGDLKPYGKKYESNNLWFELSSELVPTQDGLLSEENKKTHADKSSVTVSNIIISGHHDTKSQPLTTMVRSLCFTVGGVALLLLLITHTIAMCINILIILSVISASDTSIILMLQDIQGLNIIFTCIIIIFGMPLVFNGIGNKSPGALDNASSIACIYELARYYKENPDKLPKNIRLIFLMTGGEEVGMVGAREWVKKHMDEFPPDSTVNLNIDMVGWNRVNYVQIISKIGFLKKPASKRLTPLAMDVADEAGINLKEFWMPIGASTDSGVFASKGYDRLDFVVMDAAKKTHRSGDTPDKFSGNLAALNCEIINGMITRLASITFRKQVMKKNENK